MMDPCRYSLLFLLAGTICHLNSCVWLALSWVSAMGVDPIHFGIIMVLNLSVGLCTPPVGSVLFIGCSISGLSIDKVIKPLIPMFLAMVVVLLLVTYLPQLSLWLPAKFGF